MKHIDIEGKKVTTNYLRCLQRHCLEYQLHTDSTKSKVNLLSINQQPYLSNSFHNLFEIFRNLMKHSVKYKSVQP